MHINNNNNNTLMVSNKPVGSRPLQADQTTIKSFTPDGGAWQEETGEVGLHWGILWVHYPPTEVRSDDNSFT